MTDTARTLLIHRADALVTLDDARENAGPPQVFLRPRGGPGRATPGPWGCSHRVLRGASLLVRGPAIAAIYPADALPPGLLEQVDEVIDARGHLVTPGLVNTHHHMFQSLTRAVPAAQNAELFGWLRTLYPMWGRLTPEMIRVSTQLAMAELLLSGCTTTSDHLYLYPNGVRLDDAIEAAAGIGMRFHAARGSMSVGESAGGLPPDALVERESAILADTQRLIETYDDPGRYSRLRVVAAPCSPFSVSPDLMRESAALARSLGTRVHTHLAENAHDVAYSQARFGKTPTQYAEDLGWLGDDVWHAHCVQLDAHGIERFAATGTGVAHCPCSNMRLASGIAPVRRMLDAGVPVGLGVDGCASNDGAHLLAEARMALLLARVGRAMGPAEVQPDGSLRHGCDLGPAEMTATDALALATSGGARVLGRDDIGQLAPGMAADLVLWDLNSLSMAGGAVHDPVGALLLCASPQAAVSVVHGRVLVRDGRLTMLDTPALIARHNQLALALAAG